MIELSDNPATAAAANPAIVLFKLPKWLVILDVDFFDCSAILANPALNFERESITFFLRFNLFQFRFIPVKAFFSACYF